MILWLMITNDEYELPVAVADSAEELSRIIGVSRRTIYESKCRYKYFKTHKNKHRYIKLEIEDEDV